MKKCGKNPDAEKIHELRKRVKDLLYQTQLLLPQETKSLNYLDKLSGWLGDHHDLAMVAEKARTCADQGILPAKDTAIIGHLLTRNQRSLWKKTRKVLRKLPNLRLRIGGFDDCHPTPKTAVLAMGVPANCAA